VGVSFVHCHRVLPPRLPEHQSPHTEVGTLITSQSVLERLAVCRAELHLGTKSKSHSLLRVPLAKSREILAQPLQKAPQEQTHLLVIASQSTFKCLFAFCCSGALARLRQHGQDLMPTAGEQGGQHGQTDLSPSHGTPVPAAVNLPSPWKEKDTLFPVAGHPNQCHAHVTARLPVPPSAAPDSPQSLTPRTLP